MWCKSVNQAIWLLQTTLEDIEMIDCDHDLGDYSSDGGDGIKLLDWLAENKLYYPIKIHTMNPVGRANMERIILRHWGEYDSRKG